MAPNDSTSIRWSPKGEKLLLDADGFTELYLGDAAERPFLIHLERSEAAGYHDILRIDLNRDGILADDEFVTTTPSESRGKMWSSFNSELRVPVVDPLTGQNDANAYPLAFWYVFDPLETDPEEVLRYSRRGWMQGDGVIDGIPARVMLTESLMDGVFDTADSWALAVADSAENVLRFGDARSAERHTWLGERAYRLVSIHPSGRQLTVQFGDVGISRAEEAIQEDKLAVDRAAPRSGRTVAFSEDFEAAEAQARAEDKNLFVDFKTVWCGPCYTMDEWVFTADAVVDRAISLVAARVDGDERRDLTERFSVGAYPTVLLLSPDGHEISRHVGYLNVDSTASFLAGGGE
ncbi:MAG: thiol-disulfide isomerase/thioredoxin [Rhodothermales bacterium]|jgi:thiol-disulfide isomerase/thioredoxin